jgi:hypothetical protein
MRVNPHFLSKFSIFGIVKSLLSTENGFGYGSNQELYPIRNMRDQNSLRLTSFTSFSRIHVAKFRLNEQGAIGYNVMIRQTRVSYDSLVYRAFSFDSIVIGLMPGKFLG